jgi:hypothetical protein
MTKARILASVLVGLTALGLSWARAEANHVKIDVPNDQPAAVVVVPTPASPTVVYPAPAPLPAETLKAGDIKAHLVRAQTIYANKIEADEVQGAIHQSKGVKIGNTHGDIKSPQVSASVIYADEIKANSVVAEHIYVRNLERK